MLDYSFNDYQRQTFITSYDIDPAEGEIMINYANDKSDIVPYSVQEEKRILTRMRNQIINGDSFYQKVKESFRKANRKDKLYKILGAIFAGMCIGLARYSFLTTFLFIGAALPASITGIKKFRENHLLLSGLRKIIDDYEKGIAFIHNRESFSNKKIMKPRVIDKCSDKVTFIISNGIINDNYSEYQSTNEGVPYVDYRLFNDPEEISDLKLREESLLYEQEGIKEGYKDFSDREVPFINENSIGDLTHQELYDLYKLASQDNKGKVLVKLRRYD